MFRGTDLCFDYFRDCAKILVTAHSTSPESKCNEVYKKYSSKKLGGVALRRPATGISAMNAEFFDSYDKLLGYVAAIPKLFFFKPAKSSVFTLIKKGETTGLDQNGKRGQGHQKEHHIISPRTKRLRIEVIEQSAFLRQARRLSHEYNLTSY